jgi:hypothetical protein
MDWKAPRPAIEIAVEAIAAGSIGGAVGFAVWSLVPGGPAIAALGAALFAALSAWVVITQVGRVGRPAGDGFVPVDFTVGDEVLLLDEPVGADEPFLLDDPLSVLAEDSRVVRLFAVPATAGDAVALPAPGEMAARNEDFLEVGRGGVAETVLLPERPAAIAPDASAALHAALADIRRSLRHG